jgi:metal-dependent amidase/aminoacylase/carboxypeptidase family protein
MAQKSKAPAGVQELQGLTQDDNATKTPQANAEDIDILAFNLMTAVQMMAQMANEIVALRADMDGLKGTSAPAPVAPAPTTPTV